MAFRFSKDLRLILHPYIFVLKEGGEIRADYLDYSLLMLQIGCQETIPSPKVQDIPKIPATHLSEFDLLSTNLFGSKPTKKKANK
jgi:hypothetical protein